MPSRFSVDMGPGSSSALAPVGSSDKPSSTSSSPPPPLKQSTLAPSSFPSAAAAAAAAGAATVAPPMTKQKDFVNTKTAHLPTESAFVVAHPQQLEKDPQQPSLQPSSSTKGKQRHTAVDTDMDVDSNDSDNGAETDSTSHSHPVSQPATPNQSAYYCFGDRCFPSDPGPIPPVPSIQLTIKTAPVPPAPASPVHSTDTFSKTSSSPSMTSLVSLDEAEDEADGDHHQVNKGKSKGKSTSPQTEDTETTQEPSTTFLDASLPTSGKGKGSSWTLPSSSSSSSTSLSSAPMHPSGSNTTSQSPAQGSGSSSSSKGSSSMRPSMASHPRVASAQYTHYTNIHGSSSSSSAGEGSSSSGGGSSSKPPLARASTMQQPFSHPSSSSSSAAVPETVAVMPTLAETKSSERTFTQDDLIAYEDLPKDFDFGGGLPFYDIDPRTGVIYGDPHAVMREFLAPEACFDQYQLEHDETDPKRINIYNKHGALIYYYPGRAVGIDQDSLRATTLAGPLWTISGRVSTWNTLTATDPSTNRQIRIIMEGGGPSSRKKANKEVISTNGEPLHRFVFRWKESDCLIEYRKQKDQYRITTSEMCGGVSKWKPPSTFRPVHTFHGEGMEGNALAQINAQIGSPSPFDPTRYLQRLSEYRVQSGPVRKEGVFELHNPDTMPVELRTFLMLTSLVVFEIVRPVEEKAMIKEFPHLVKANRHRLAISSANRHQGTAAMASIGTPGMTAMALRTAQATNSSSAATTIQTRPSATSTASFHRPPPDYFSIPSSTLDSTRAAVGNTAATSTSSDTPPPPSVQAATRLVPSSPPQKHQVSSPSPASPSPPSTPKAKRKWGLFSRK